MLWKIFLLSMFAWMLAGSCPGVSPLRYSLVSVLATIMKWLAQPGHALIFYEPLPKVRLIEYNGAIEVHPSLLIIAVLHEWRFLRRTWTRTRSACCFSLNWQPSPFPIAIRRLLLSWCRE
jgi:hypothetical protein